MVHTDIIQLTRIGILRSVITLLNRNQVHLLINCNSLSSFTHKTPTKMCVPTPDACYRDEMFLVLSQ